MENEWKWPKWWNTVQAHVVALILYWFQIVLPLAGMFFQNCDLVWPWDYWDVPSASPTPTAPCRGRVWLCHWWAAFRFVGASSRGENGIVSPSVFILWRLLPPEVNTKNPQKWRYPIYFWVLKILKKVGYIYIIIYIYLYLYLCGNTFFPTLSKATFLASQERQPSTERPRTEALGLVANSLFETIWCIGYMSYMSSGYT